jgi:hypothetical protein
MIVIYDRNDSGQYYNTRITIVIDNTSLSMCRQYDRKLTLQIVASLRIVTYDHNSFIIQATE